jgi:hypothetical protein
MRIGSVLIPTGEKTDSRPAAVVMARLVRAIWRGTVLVRMARTMTGESIVRHSFRRLV